MTGIPRTATAVLDILTEVGAQRERAVLVELLVASPAHGIAHSLHLDLGLELQPFPICDVRQDQLCLPNLGRPRIASVQTTARERLPIRTRHGHTQYARYTRDAVVGEAHDQPHTAAVLIAPDEFRYHPVANCAV